MSPALSEVLLCNSKFPLIMSYSLSCLQLTTVDDGGLLVVLDGTAAGASSLKSLDDVHGLLVSDLTENDVASVEPRGDDSGDEELGAVGVGAGVSHGEQTGLAVLQLEVLVGELLTVDGLATSAVATGEVTTLKHELGDDAVEGRALVAEALLAGAKGAEVLGRLGDDIIVQIEVDAALLNGYLAGRLAILHDRTLPLDIEKGLDSHGCG
jgi:hypothetical protein